MMSSITWELYCSKPLFFVQLLSCVRLFATPWTAAHQASQSFTTSSNLLKLIPTELVMPSNHLILCRPLLLLFSIFPSIRVFSNESAPPIRWTKYWSFSFSISPSNVYSGWISFSIDWFDLLVVQGTLKTLLILLFVNGYSGAFIVSIEYELIQTLCFMNTQYTSTTATVV